jgi:hypothetical protein
MNPLMALCAAEPFYCWLDELIEHAEAPQEMTYDEVRDKVLMAILASSVVAGSA